MLEITAVHLDGGERHEHITRLHGVNSTDGITYECTRDHVIQLIEGGTRVYVSANGYTVDVRVVNARPPYVRTYRDNTPTDNLLYLPRF